VFNRKQPQAEPFEPADWIDLLLDADETTRRLLMLHAIQSRALSRAEAEDLMAQATRLERAAGPRREPQPEPEPRAAWGIEYP